MPGGTHARPLSSAYFFVNACVSAENAAGVVRAVLLGTLWSAQSTQPSAKEVIRAVVATMTTKKSFSSRGNRRPHPGGGAVIELSVTAIPYGATLGRSPV